ncbi:MAG: helix-turn-helix transcriptional regulator [Bacillota bacterium]
MEFKNILLKLMEENGLNQRQLGVNSGIPVTTISGWLNLNRLPYYDALKKLSQYFGVSADFLLGLEGDFGDKLYGSVMILPGNTEEKMLVSKFSKLSKGDKEKVLKMVDLIVD